MAITMVLGASLAAGRRFLGLSQEDLAQLAGAHRTTINRFERHNARPVTAHPLLLREVVGQLEKRGVRFLPDGSVECRALPHSETD